MAFGFSKTRYSPIAIDFGADSIKLLQIVDDQPPQFVAAASSVMPDAARTDAQARQAFCEESLKNLMGSQPFKGRRVMLGIPAFQMLIQHIQISTSEQQDLDSQVGLELQQRLNVDPDRMVIRHFPVAQIMRDGVNRQEMICLAASKDVVMQYIDLARRCKLDVVGMHSEPLCMVRAFEHLYRRTDDAKHTTCFIDIGAVTTKLVIAHGKQMVFAKSIHAAGDQITRRVAAETKISFIDARSQRLAQTSGTGQPGRTPASAAVTSTVETDAALDPSTALATAQVKPPVAAAADDNFAGETQECLIDETQLCLRHYRSLFLERKVEKLIFLGGESNHRAMCQAMAKALRITAQLGDPFARMVNVTKSKQPPGVDLHRPQPGWAVPMGLTLSEANL